MAKSFRELSGAPPSTASTKDSVLVVIDAQNEYATGVLKTKGVDSTRGAIAALVDKYRRSGGKQVHIVHSVPPGTPVFTPETQLAEEFEEVKARGEKVGLRKTRS